MRLLFYLAAGAAILLLCAAGTAGATEPKIVLASLQPLDECTNPATPWLRSGCVDVPKAHDRITVPCKTKPGMCPLSWGLPKDEGKYWVNTLPPIVVVKPAPRRAVVHARRIAGAGRVKVARAAHVPPQPAQNIPNTQGRDMARGMSVQAVGVIGSVLGLDPTIGLGICTLMTFSFMVQDGIEAKETWTPIDAMGNIVLSAVGCSPLGIVLRLAQMNAGQTTATVTQPAKPVVRVTKRQVRHNRVALSP